MSCASAPVGDGEDFRGGAAAASVALYESLVRKDPTVARDPMKAGVSLCLPAEGDGQAARRRYKVIVILRLVLGFVGIGLGAAIGSAVDRPQGFLRRHLRESQILALAASSSLAGMFVLIETGAAQRRFVLRRVGPRLGREQTGTRPPVLEVEDTATFTKLKAASEDLGVLLLYPQRRCVVVEGLTHRYIIHAGDVTEVRDVAAPGGVGVGILYRAAGVPLDITLRRVSALVELKRKLTGSGRDSVTERIGRTFRGEVV